jgi:sialidase-1
MSQMSRRRWCQAAAAALVGTTARRSRAAEAELLETRVISYKAPLYHGWPTLARRKNGELLLAFSGGREAHVCPFGRVELMRSQDDGKNWRWPQVIYDGPIDDRDAGILETAQGSILITTFTSLAYQPILEKQEKIPVGGKGAWEPAHLLEWQNVHGRITAEQRQAELGCWMIRSTDGGVNWSARYRVPLNSPHGPINLSDGRVLYPGVALWEKDRKVGVCRSADDGQTWEWISDIPPRAGDDPLQYHELHAVEAADGSVVCHIRNHNKTNAGEILQCESKDAGQTWTEPHPIGVWGLPSHLLRLRDSRLLMSYGYRKAPFGNQARISTDHGRTWGEPIRISGDGFGGDLGYPSTVECDDGTLVTAWYERLKESELAQLRQARWRLKS